MFTVHGTLVGRICSASQVSKRSLPRVAYRLPTESPCETECQADKSAVATVWKTKELKTRDGVCQERIVTSVLEAISPVRAALLSAEGEQTEEGEDGPRA